MGWQATANFGQLMTQEDNHTNKRPNPQSLQEGQEKAAAKGPFMPNEQKAMMEKYGPQIIPLPRKPASRGVWDR